MAVMLSIYRRVEVGRVKDDAVVELWARVMRVREAQPREACDDNHNFVTQQSWRYW